ncbi:MAG: lipoprotein [Methylotenera sp.]|nr:lipoprotein [Methylotenera sp.]MDD4924891.1 lipoprotein [Methylotenera sp.]NOS95799.1 lipoprotein [Methylotenera sp.]NOU41220.1 lipoprotein [Methylotenera sp.]
MKISPKKIILLLLVSYILTACGTKGPLYIPEQQYPQPTPTGK